MKAKIKNASWLLLVFATVFLMISLFVAPVQANDDVTIVVKGGFGVNIEITNNLENDTITYNFTVLWKNIHNKVLHITNAHGTIPPYITHGYKEAHVRLFAKVYVHVESEGVIVEREGFSILVFVFLKPNIEPTIL